MAKNRELQAGSMSDSGQIAQIESRLKDSSRKLHSLSVHVGSARQVKAFDGDRRKNLLAKYVVRHLKAGETSTAAESLARADEVYQTELESLANQYAEAEKTIMAYEAEYCSFEAARSLLSMARESFKTLQG